MNRLPSPTTVVPLSVMPVTPLSPGWENFLEEPARTEWAQLPIGS